MKNDGGQTEPKATEGAGSAGSAGAEIIRPDGQADATLLRSLSLLFIERQDDIIEELIKMATSLFPISSMIVFTFDEEIGRFVSTSVVGYPQERVVEMKEKITYTPESIKEDESYSRPLSRFSRLYPAELFSDVSDQDLLETLHPENVNEKREDEGAWHPLDRVSFFFIDRFGKEIGYLYITSTSDNRMLSAEAVAGLDIIASMASVAIELASVRHTEQSQLETQERRAAQISQILAVATSILSITNPSNLIEKVLTSIYDLFGLKSNTLTLYDDAEGCYKWVGFSGYTEAQMARARKLKTPREIIERDTRPEYRIGYLAHFKPAEKAIPDDFSQYFIFNEEAEALKLLDIPRKSPDSWHALDDLAFLVLDRTGKTIGVIYVDQPIDGKIPSRESIEMIEIFVSLVAIALENAHLYSEANVSKEGVHVLNRLMFHDLMNYSMAIRGYLDLAAGNPDEASSREYINRALRQVEQTAALVEKVRKLSAIRGADRKNMLRIDLARTISTQSTKTSSIFPSKTVIYSFNFEVKEAFVMANDLLPDLFHNIFMNAIKFDMHESVLIEVGLKESTEVTGESQTKSWRVSIADHGPGIPDERKRSIFIGAHKSKLHEPAKGMGLGLSIVKSLVDLYGGKVWAEDREQGHPERGIVFLVQLPQA